MSTVYEVHNGVDGMSAFDATGAKGDVKGHSIDCQGFDALTFLIGATGVASNENIEVKIEESDDSAFTSPSTVDPSLVIGETTVSHSELTSIVSSHKSYKISIIGRKKPYVRLTVNFAVGVNTKLDIRALLANKRDQP